MGILAALQATQRGALSKRGHFIHRQYSGGAMRGTEANKCKNWEIFYFPVESVLGGTIIRAREKQNNASGRFFLTRKNIL